MQAKWPLNWGESIKAELTEKQKKMQLETEERLKMAEEL